MREAIDWSFGLLSPPEQRLFQILGGFVGGWTLEGADLLWMTAAADAGSG